MSLWYIILPFAFISIMGALAVAFFLAWRRDRKDINGMPKDPQELLDPVKELNVRRDKIYGTARENGTGYSEGGEPGAYGKPDQSQKVSDNREREGLQKLGSGENNRASRRPRLNLRGN